MVSSPVWNSWPMQSKRHKMKPLLRVMFVVFHTPWSVGERAVACLAANLAQEIPMGSKLSIWLS